MTCALTFFFHQPFITMLFVGNGEPFEQLQGAWSTSYRSAQWHMDFLQELNGPHPRPLDSPCPWMKDGVRGVRGDTKRWELWYSNLWYHWQNTHHIPQEGLVWDSGGHNLPPSGSLPAAWIQILFLDQSAAHLSILDSWDGFHPLLGPSGWLWLRNLKPNRLRNCKNPFIIQLLRQQCWG